MLDFIITTPAKNIRLVPDCLRAIEASTDVPMTIKVMVDGGKNEAVDEVRATLSGLPTHVEWRLAHEEKPVGQLALINRALRTPKNALTVLMPSFVRLEDKKWVSKIKQVFDRDPGAAIVDMHPNTIASSSAPIRRTRKLPPFYRDFAVIKTRFLAGRELVLSEAAAVSQWFEAAFATGHSAWHHPAVRYHVVDHEDHKLCVSQSQTTPR